MKIERTKNAIRSSAFGIINKIITLFIPFLVRTIFIKKLGMEYLGLNTLFTSILSILNIAELGIGTSIVYNMYSAISEDNIALICSLLKFYKKAYRVVGCIILTLGIALMPAIPYLIKGTVPDDINVFVLFFIHLGNTLLGYFLFAYKSCLLNAFQRNDVVSNIGTACSLLTYLLQILVLLLGKNYYYYISIILISSIVYNIVTEITVNKMYSNYKPIGELEFKYKAQIIKKVKSLFLYNIGGIVLISVDSIVISSYFGLNELAKYNNYYCIIQTIFGFLTVIYTSITSGIGNSIATDTLDKNYHDFKRLFFLNKWVIGWFSTCLLCLYQPFMDIWLGSKMMYPFGVVICFTIYFYVWKMMEIVNVYKNAAGLWEYDKFRPIVASFVNLTLNLILCRYIGIYGILISTIISVILVIFPWSTYVLFKYYFKTGFKNYLLEYMLNTVISLVICAVTYLVSNHIRTENMYFTFILKVGLSCLIPNFLLFLIYSKTKIFKETCFWLFNKLGNLFVY